MTAKELKRILKKVADDTEVLVGTAEILKIERKISNRKMQLVIIPK